MQGNKINSTCNFQERDTHLKNTNLDLIALLDFISSYYADIVQLFINKNMFFFVRLMVGRMIVKNCRPTLSVCSFMSLFYLKKQRCSTLGLFLVSWVHLQIYHFTYITHPDPKQILGNIFRNSILLFYLLFIS